MITVYLSGGNFKEYANIKSKKELLNFVEKYKPKTNND